MENGPQSDRRSLRDAPKARPGAIRPLAVLLVASLSACSDSGPSYPLNPRFPDNRPPVVAPIAALSVAEGAQSTLEVTATDPDGDTLNLVTPDLPAFIVVETLGPGAWQLSVAPGFDDAGDYALSATVSDTSAATDSVAFTVSVTDVNRAPTLSAPGDVAIAEGNTQSLLLSASDPDGDALSFSGDMLPGFAALTDLDDGTARLDLQPGFLAGGNYALSIEVADSGGLSDRAEFQVSVADVNRMPMLAPLADVVIAENEVLQLPLSASDPDGGAIALALIGSPSFVSAVDAGNGTGSLIVMPGYFDSGAYALLVRATDAGGLFDEMSVAISVGDVNRPPELIPIGPAELAENETLVVPIAATDPDGDAVSLEGTGLPGFATLTDAGNGAHSLILTPGYADSGTYAALVRATDAGGLFDEADLPISVTNVNRAPQLAPTGPAELAEGDTLVVPIAATDPDGDAISLEGTGLPGFVTLTDSGDGTGSLVLEPDFSDSGSYALTITAADGESETAEVVIAVTVTDVNRDPVFSAIADQSLDEGAALLIPLSASDPDGDALTLEAVSLPAFASITDNGDGSGTLALQPGFQESGTHTVTLQASDTALATAQLTLTVVVNEVNRPPLLSSVGNATLAEGTVEILPLDASDPDGDAITFEADALPAFATLEDYGDGTAALRLGPQVLDAGTYALTVRVRDSGAPSLADDALVQVTVTIDGSNHVARENSLPGTPDWHLDNPALLREIEGYASANSVNRGEIISLFVNTAAPSYSLEVFRTGWYGGDGARRVLGPLDVPGTAQITPAPDPVTGLVEANWVNPYDVQTSDSIAGDPWPTGVYLARLTESVGGKQSYVIFVVREDGYAHDVLLQIPVTTYQAYNNWGGKSVYDFNSGPTEPWGSSAGPRASHLSFDRPYARNPHDPAGYGMGAGEYLTNVQPVGRIEGAGWDYNMVRWLEYEQYDVGYITNLDTHRAPSSLLDTEVFVSQGHDEYWTWEMFNHVEAARDAGIDLAFFASNAAYYQIRLEPSSVTGQPDRTMVVYKTAALDPYFYDLNPLNDYLTTHPFRYYPVSRPEEALIGVQYVLEPVDTDIIVTNSTHWVFDKTGLEDGDLLVGLLGYEPDGMFGDGPANIEVLAETPIVSEADPTQQGISHMTVYSTPDASVYATGSLQWSWGLDDYNVPQMRSSRLSAAAQQITANVLERFGARPYVGDAPVQAACVRIVSLADAAADGTMGAAEIDVLDAGGNTLPKSGWSVAFVDSEGPAPPVGAAANALDDDLSTYWRTRHNNGPEHPHEIQIDLGGGYEIAAVRLTPPQIAALPGNVTDYEVYASPDCVSWSLVANGTWHVGLGRKLARFGTFQ